MRRLREFAEGHASEFLFRLTVALFCRLICDATAPADENRLALVIGNAAYKDAPLKNPAFAQPKSKVKWV